MATAADVDGAAQSSDADDANYHEQVEDPGAMRRNPVTGFFSALVSKDTWSKVGSSTADAAKRAYTAVAKNKTVRHLTTKSTWGDREKVCCNFFHRSKRSFLPDCVDLRF